ncbi:NAD-dependent epimerase/dehydratase family protein [Geodermatophilus sp. SYSU D00710]
MTGPAGAAQHVVLGAGAVGRTLVEVLHRRGERSVRLVSRSGAPAPDGVEVVRGDVTDPAFARAVTAGARVVHQALNPPYARWAAEFPRLQAAALAGAQAAGARLVSTENVYAYGRAGGRPFTEDRPHAATTRKGRLRAAMSGELLAAHRAGRVEVVIARASDYYGPRGGAQSNLGDRVFRAVLAGRAATVLGDPDQPQTYTHVPDIAEGLAALGDAPDAGGQVWHLPNDPATHTARELVHLACAAAGRPPVAVRRVPTAVLRAAGLVDRPVRELVEMRYEFEEPFVVDSSRITERLGLRATPYEEGVARTLDSYR